MEGKRRGGEKGRGSQRLRIGRKNGGREEKARRFSRWNITMDFISCSSVNDIYDRKSWRTATSFSLSSFLSLWRDPSETISFRLRKGEERERKRERKLSFPFDERKINVCGSYVRGCALSNWNFKNVNVFAAEKYERREGSFEKICDWCEGFCKFFKNSSRVNVSPAWGLLTRDLCWILMRI